MKIAILHRIPFDKIRYDKIIDHLNNDVYYICLQGNTDGLPKNAKIIELNNQKFDADELITYYSDFFSSVDRVISRSEYDLLSAAKIRAHFTISGDHINDILPLRNKWIMRSRCKQNNILQPEFWHPLEFVQEMPRMGNFVLKPREEASSNGIVVGDFNTIKKAILKLDNSDAMLVEEFIDGTIYHFDGWIHNGVPLAFVSSYYISNCLHFADGGPLGSVQTITEHEHVDLVINTLGALDYQNGSFHFEAIKDINGHFWFLEVAARVGGAGGAETFQLRTGLNLYHADLCYQLFGFPPEYTTLISDIYYGWFVYPAHKINFPYILNFSPQEWKGNLLYYQHHQNTLSQKSISYSSTSSPLSGVVFGRQAEIVTTIESIFNICKVERI